MKSILFALTAAVGYVQAARVKYGGTNIAGFDFGCGTDGTCDTSKIVDPGAAGLAQMQHFVSQTGLNTFRLPVGWQYLVNNQLGGTLDAANFAKYNTLVQNCLSTGAALCIVDVHNYARWNGQIIGQSSVTNAQFSSLWSQLAAKYANNARIAFGLMNEPHDLNVQTWGQTVQAAVTAIRQAGATSNLILLPGSDYTHAAQSVSDGSFAALSAVTNGINTSKTGLIFDVHQYLDSDGSGTHTNCVTNNQAVFSSFATTLRAAGRQAILTETGGGPNDSSCLTNVCQELQTLSQNSDVYLGWTGWSAGAFATSYEITETPNGSPGAYTDQPLVSQCIAGVFESGA